LELLEDIWCILINGAQEFFDFEQRSRLPVVFSGEIDRLSPFNSIKVIVCCLNLLNYVFLSKWVKLVVLVDCKVESPEDKRVDVVFAAPTLLIGVVQDAPLRRPRNVRPVAKLSRDNKLVALPVAGHLDVCSLLAVVVAEFHLSNEFVGVLGLYTFHAEVVDEELWVMILWHYVLSCDFMLDFRVRLAPDSGSQLLLDSPRNPLIA